MYRRNEFLVVKEIGNYGRPYEKEEDYFLSGKELERKYPEYTAFLQPGVVAVVVNLTTNKIVRKVYNRPIPLPVLS